ncbi:MAG TPA: DUF2339 domain-containing protein, partial [Thermoanaerobaculia bacterium]|nr:DUF2339 domain-containing protein [Thermoanaerobaculia bacterium]
PAPAPAPEPAPEPEPVVAPVPAPAPAPAPVPEPPVVRPEPLPIGPTLADRLRSALDLEQMLGANWLSKIGVAILVLGVAFFLAWQLRELGPAGKIVVGTVVAGALLGAGIWGERSERYRIFARASLAGGWSLLFFVAYAAHHIAAARVIDSPLLGFALMLAVVAAMVAHTLRFRSQVVTGLAFGIAFATVAVNRVDVYSLTANVALAIGFVVVIVRMRWFALEVLGIIAVYFNHFVWLVPIITPMRGKVHPFPQFYASATILLVYWAVFRASYVVRPPVDERTSAVAGVLNTALMLAVMKYQSAHPELAFWALLALGATELLLSRLPVVRRKRMTFLVLTTLGVILMIAAIPFRYAPGNVSPIWLVEAALLLIIGIITSERAYQLLGQLGAMATALQLVSVPGARLLGWRLGGVPPERETVLGVIFLAAMAAFYAAAEWVPRRWPAMFERPLDRRLARYISYAAALMGVIGGWALFPTSGAAVAWIALALIVAYAAQRLESFDLMIEANALAVAAVIRVLAVNLPAHDGRLPTVAIVIAAIYLMSRWNRFPAAATWTASALVALLAWYQLLPISVAVAWTIAGVVLAELRLSRHLRWQGYALLAGAFVRLFVVNMNAEQGPRLYTIVPILIAFLYVYARHDERAFAWLAAIGGVALLRFELPNDFVAIGWAALTLLLVAFAALSGRRVFAHIGIAVAVAALARGVLHNLYERSYFPPPANAPRWLLVAAASALLFAALPFAFRLRQLDAAPEPRRWAKLFRWLDARPEQILFFVPVVLVTALLAAEARKGVLTASWGVEAVVVFLFALWVGERSYRLTGLALLLLCVGKIFVFDFWSLTLRDKALTGIVVGAALIGVSILYARKREAILQFL